MHKISFTMSLFHACTCFEHHVLIIRRSKLYYTASGIITPIGVMITTPISVMMTPVSSTMCSSSGGQEASGIITPIGVMIPEAV